MLSRKALIIITIIPILFITAGTSFAAEKYAGEFLNLGAGARPLGMGGSFTAVADDATAAYWNPAGIGGFDQSQITFMHASIFGLDSYDFLNFVQPVSKSSSLGISWIRLGIDEIPITDLQRSGSMSASNRPYITGYMKDTENAVLLSYGRKIRLDVPMGSHRSIGTYIQVGGNFKFIYNAVSGISRNAVGFGGDIGVIWRTSFASEEGKDHAGDLSLGIVVQDFTKTRLFWNTTSSPSHIDVIPRNLKIGAAYLRNLPAIGSKVLLSVDADTRYDLQMRYGLECVLGDVLALRAGLQDSNFTTGAGLHVGFARGESSLNFLIDYAFLSHELGNTHRISLLTKF
ncbi:PorV/PorQ family protein [Candidatus Poribacteria bacterium]|nr:PorV/PorQ family protein [Candidatus Poribacteria bacterium]